MSESTEQESRTEAATPRRLQRAREAGQVAMSRECVALAVLAATALVATLLTVPLARRFAAALATLLHLAAGEEQGAAAGSLLALAGHAALLGAGPFVLAALLAGTGAVLLQTGFLASAAPLHPKLSRLNPWSGLKRLFGVDGLVEVFRAIAKLAAMVIALCLALRGESASLVAAVSWPVPALLDHMLRLILRVLLAVLAAQALIAAADLFWVRYRHGRSLRMSREEMKEETKETEGDPRIKARIRQIRQLRARRRMLAAVPTATVVVTNPTHYAVALAYDRAQHAAPRVVAKGVDAMAARIREAAAEHHVPVVANPPLARALYRVELDHEIPAEHFKLVAEIIAYVWRLDRRATNLGGAA
jgi:flagellar biosynthesis protein FlhB